MKVYHGSYTRIERPMILMQEKGRDFGYGFYATTIREQAERWAVRVARLCSRRSGMAESAVVNVYDFDEEAAERLRSKSFPNADLEWLDFVIRCRSDASFRHEYDIVSGKIANDNVGETVEYVLAGIMRREDAVARLRFEKINDQICFCTEKSLRVLAFVENYVLKSVDWRNPHG